MYVKCTDCVTEAEYFFRSGVCWPPGDLCTTFQCNCDATGSCTPVADDVFCDCVCVPASIRSFSPALATEYYQGSTCSGVLNYVQYSPLFGLPCDGYPVNGACDALSLAADGQSILTVCRGGTTQCETTPSGDDCSFYQNCLEAAHPCGKDEYALGFGLKYCQAFLDNEVRFSPAGQAWSQYVRPCLQQAIQQLLPGVQHMTCEDIAVAAIRSHIACYLNGPVSVCDLPVSDSLFILNTVKASLVPIMSRYWYRIDQQFAQVGWECLPEKFSTWSIRVEEKAEDMYEKGRAYLESLGAASVRSIVNAAEKVGDDITNDIIQLIGLRSGSSVFDFSIMLNQSQTQNATQLFQAVCDSYNNGTLAFPRPIIELNETIAGGPVQAILPPDEGSATSLRPGTMLLCVVLGLMLKYMS